MMNALSKVYKKKINYIDVTRTTDTFKDVKFHALIDEDSSIFGSIQKDSEIDIINQIVKSYLERIMSNYQITKSL
jgi:hypothetical protein